VRQALQGTSLATASIVPVSARTGQGLPQVIAALEVCLAQRQPRPDLGRPRLPIDRVFTIAGFGTVVTGTLLDGQLALGQEVEVLPGGLRGRIRGLQTHKEKEQTAVPGSRTAVNLSGVDVSQVHRGDVLALPGVYQSTRLLDVRFRLLPGAAAPLRHGAQVKLFLGSAEALAHLRLLGVETLEPGQEAWLQLELRQPLVALRGDRYILRRPSPAETLGGGVVLDPQPRRHRRFDPAVLAHLESLQRGAPQEVLAAAFQALGLTSLRDATARSRLPAEAAGPALAQLLESGQLRLLEPGQPAPQADLLAVLVPTWQTLSQRAAQETGAFHAANPLRRGMPREALKSRLKLTTRPFNAAMRVWVQEGALEEHGVLVNRPGHQVRFTPVQQAAVERLLTAFAAAPFTPPSVKECQAQAGEEVYQALLDQHTLVQVSPEVVFRRADYEEMLRQVREHLASEGTLTVAQFRDRFQTSRKYALGFLEHLDTSGVTVREGDFRRAKH
jgi:selenocysteine-specific elongation factor